MCSLMRLLGRAAKLGAPILGIVLIVAALTADVTGADPEGNWGPARRQILGVGIALAAGSALYFSWPAIDRLLLSVGRASMEAARASGRRVLRFRPIGSAAQIAGRLLLPFTAPGRAAATRPGRLRALLASRERRVGLLSLLVFALAVPVYLWIVSVGYWTNWPSSTHYYSDLAEAFRHGQLHLLETPDPELLALQDPYDPALRGQIPFLWDVVLFGGRFYLYWGPLPAVLVAGWASLVPGVVGDNVLVFLFILATVLFTLLLMAQSFVALFPRLKARDALLPLLVAAFAYPLPWLMSGPAIYEASIAGGQAFLMGALYFSARVLLGQRRAFPNLFVAGVLLACAVGSKASLALTAVFWAVVIILAAMRSSRLDAKPRGRLVAALSFALPLLFGFACLGWYNEQRFGSPFEFGVRYQLTGMDLDRDYSQAFSILNVPINLYTYLFTGVETAGSFPWVRPILGNTGPPPLAWASLHVPGAQSLTPALYYSEQVTGVFYALPFAAFGMIGLMLSLQRVCARSQADLSSPGGIALDAGSDTAARYSFALAIGGVLAFAPTLLFVFATARYIADMAPVLVILAALGVWRLRSARSGKGETTWWVGALAWFLGLISIAMSLTLAFPGYLMRFERLNPELFERITSLLTW